MNDLAVRIVEVGPRDGLQNESAIIATEDKIALIERMIEAGARRLEVASFVHPVRVPQMADAEAVIAGLPDRPDVSYIGLCLNRRGVERAARTRAGNKRASTRRLRHRRQRRLRPANQNQSIRLNPSPRKCRDACSRGAKG